MRACSYRYETMAERVSRPCLASLLLVGDIFVHNYNDKPFFKARGWRCAFEPVRRVLMRRVLLLG